MLFQFFSHQLEPERPTISSKARRASENGQMAIGGNMRVEMVSDVSSSFPNPVITVKKSYGRAANKA